MYHSDTVNHKDGILLLALSQETLSTGSAPRILRLGCTLESPDGFRNPKAQVMVQNCIKVSEAGLESSVVYKVPQVISKVKLVLRTTGTIIPIL